MREDGPPCASFCPAMEDTVSAEQARIQAPAPCVLFPTVLLNSDGSRDVGQKVNSHSQPCPHCTEQPCLSDVTLPYLLADVTLNSCGFPLKEGSKQAGESKA